jgi:hypothetical protein
MGNYDPGQIARLGITLTVDGTVTDPTTIKIRVKPKTSPAVEYVYGVDSNVTKLSTGVYRAAITITDDPGQWQYRWISTGTAATVAPSFITINPLAFT